MLVCFLKDFTHGVGRDGERKEICTLRQIDIPFRTKKNNLGAALLSFPHKRRTFLRFKFFCLLCGNGKLSNVFIGVSTVYGS